MPPVSLLKIGQCRAFFKFARREAIRNSWRFITQASCFSTMKSMHPSQANEHVNDTLKES